MSETLVQFENKGTEENVFDGTPQPAATDRQVGAGVIRITGISYAGEDPSFEVPIRPEPSPEMRSWINRPA